MKKIVCELCDGTEFTKEGGMFVCNGCGTRYSVEEAKSMMKEVEGAAPAVASATGVSAGNPNQQQIDNILMLASNAYSASNNEETEKYCNRAIELDATCYKAWLLKGKAAGWSSTIQNPRIAEAAHSFKQAVDFAPEDEKDSLAEEAADELKRLGLACISLRQGRFAKFPDDEELNGFVSDMEPLINGLVILLSKQAEVATKSAIDELLEAASALGPSIKFLNMKNKATKAGVPKEYFSQIAVMMGNAAIDGYNTATKRFNSDTRPMQNDFTKTMNEIDNCMTLLGMANNASDDDDDDDISRLKSRITMQEYVINMRCYADFSSSYRTVSLTDSAKAGRREDIAQWKDEIKEIEDKAKAKAEEEKKKAEEEKRARIEAYWAAHQDEKQQLDAELLDLQAKKKQHDDEIADLDKQIRDAKAEESCSVPSEEETANLNKQITELKTKKSGLGLFAGKEKKQIDEQIATLEGRVSALKDKIAEEKKARADEVQKRVKPLQDKVDELNKKKAAAEKRIKAIEAELTKDPEE